MDSRPQSRSKAMVAIGVATLVVAFAGVTYFGLQALKPDASEMPFASASPEAPRGPASSKNSQVAANPARAKSVGGDRSRDSDSRVSERAREGASDSSDIEAAPEHLIGTRDPYENAPVLFAEDEHPNLRGEFTRRKVVQTGGKYSLILVQQNCQVRRPASDEPAAHDETCAAAQAMVADHIVVKLRPGFNETDLTRYITPRGGRIRNQLMGTELYLVEFKATDVHSVETMIAEMRRAPMVQDPEADWVVRN